MLSQKFLSVIIPAYNEEKRIVKTLLSVDKYLSERDYDYEILVIDDGSRDNTVTIVKNFKKMIKNLDVIENKENHGKGWVVRQGMLAAKGKYRLFTDADNSTSPDQAKNLLSWLKGVKTRNGIVEKIGFYDIAIGSRAIKGARVVIKQPIVRVLAGKASNFLIQSLALPGIWDSQCGFKIFTAKAASDIFKKATINRWGFDIEILALGRRLGYKIKEVPVTWMNDPDSKVSLRGYLNTFRELLKIRINLWRNIYKIKTNKNEYKNE